MEEKLKVVPGISKQKRAYLKYLESEAWTKLRCDIFQLRGPKCERCNKLGTQVHHLTYENLGHENPEDVILLCWECHQREHDLIKGKPVKKRKKGPRLSKKQRKAERIKAKAQEYTGPKWGRICPKCFEPLKYHNHNFTCVCGYEKAETKRQG